jgi:beta-galactosidase
MRIYENFNGDWTFRHGFEPGAVGRAQDGETVRLPHSAVELPYNYFDETEYQKPFTYQKTFERDRIPEALHLPEDIRLAPGIRGT